MEGWVLSRLASSGADEKERALSPSCGVGLAPFSSIGDAFAEQRPSSRDLVDAPCEEARLSPQDQIECERVS